MPLRTAGSCVVASVLLVGGGFTFGQDEVDPFGAPQIRAGEQAMPVLPANPVAPDSPAVLNAVPITNEPPPGELQSSIALPEDTARRRQLEHTTRLEESGRYVDAAQALGRLAEAIGDSDVFIRIGRPGQKQALGSLKAEVQRRIGMLPAEGKAAYELAFGRAARRMLSDAHRDRAAVQHVASIYLHTQAGAEALYRLAVLHRDRGEFHEAATCLEYLRATRPDEAKRFEPNLAVQLSANRAACGDADAATAELRNALRQTQARPIVVAGGDIALQIADVESFATLDKVFGTASSSGPATAYTHHPGEADRPITQAGEPLLIPRWSRELSGVTHARAGSRASAPTVPVLFPTVIGDRVLLPTGRGFSVFDRDSGRPLWDYPSDGDGEPSRAFLWSHLAAGRLSTDGRSVFLVEAEGNGSPPPADPNAVLFNPFGNFGVQRQAMVNPAAQGAWGFDESTSVGALDGFRTLSALDVTPPRQGNRLWKVGGASGGAEPKLAGHTFMGPPLAVHGRLYAIADNSQTVRLVVLDASTGRLDWSLDLGHIDATLAGNSLRTEIGATPTLSRGVLLCPTGGGAIIAVDLARRSLRWGYRYPQQVQSDPFGNDGFGNQVHSSHSQRWNDQTIHIAGNLVLLTPPESDFLYCLDFESGHFHWRLPRGEHLFVADTAADRLLLIRQTGTTLLKANDGTPVGTSGVFPSGTAPSGHGFVAADHYVQPLTDGSLVAINRANGEISETQRSSRDLVLGNLIWHDGLLLSAGPDFLHAFDDDRELTKSLETRLADGDTDVPALLRRADRHTANGRYAEAIGDCRQAFTEAPSPRTKGALVAALLDGVRHQLPAAEEYDAELRRLALLVIPKN